MTKYSQPKPHTRQELFLEETVEHYKPSVHPVSIKVNGHKLDEPMNTVRYYMIASASQNGRVLAEYNDKRAPRTHNKTEDGPFDIQTETENFTASLKKGLHERDIPTSKELEITADR